MDILKELYFCVLGYSLSSLYETWKLIAIYNQLNIYLILDYWKVN